MILRSSDGLSEFKSLFRAQHFDVHATHAGNDLLKVFGHSAARQIVVPREILEDIHGWLRENERTVAQAL